MKDLVQCLGIFPVGTLVELSNRSLAVVHENHADHNKYPSVTVISDSQKNLIEKPFVVNLQKIRNQKQMIRGELYSDDVEIKKVIDLASSPRLRRRVSAYFQEHGFNEELQSSTKTF